MIELKDMNIIYDNRTLIKNGTIKFYKGSVHLITGNSGSGKSTLLYRVGLISNDINYKYFINGRDILLENELYKSQIRRFCISYVLQEYTLFEQYDVLGNLRLYSDFVHKKYNEKELRSFLDMVHLNVSFSQLISTLSGGEKQRLAIACALCKNCDILILDEPTSALDENNSIILFNVLLELAHKHDKCVIFSSHSSIAKEYADIIYTIENGKLLVVNDNVQKNHSNFYQIQTKRKLHFNFYINYIKYFQKKFKNLNKLILSIMTISILTSFISIYIVDFYTDKSKGEIIKMGSNQLFISNSKQDIFVDDLVDPIKNSIIQKVINERECSFASPYYQLKTTYVGKKIYILPYYDQNDFSHLELCKLDTRESKGLYISYNVYTAFIKDNLNSKEMELELEVKNTKNSKEQVIKKKFSVNAALKEGYVSPYYQSSPYYIYMYYKDIIDIYNQFNDNDEFLGYTLFTKNYQDLIILQNKLNSLSIGVNDKFIDATAIDNVVKTSILFRNILFFTIMIIFSIILITLQMNYFYKREREFALLKINGLYYTSLIKLAMLEILSMLIVSVILSISLYILFLLLLYSNSIMISININTMFLICFISLVAILTCELFATYFYFKNMVPESIIRK